MGVYREQSTRRLLKTKNAIESRYPDMAGFSSENNAISDIGLRLIVSELLALSCSCVRQNAAFRPSAFWRTQLHRTLPCQDLWSQRSRIGRSDRQRGRGADGSTHRRVARIESRARNSRRVFSSRSLDEWLASHRHSSIAAVGLRVTVALCTHPTN
jgi:hypothetical protein